MEEAEVGAGGRRSSRSLGADGEDVRDRGMVGRAASRSDTCRRRRTSTRRMPGTSPRWEVEEKTTRWGRGRSIPAMNGRW